jgi:hypothetical protein
LLLWFSDLSLNCFKSSLFFRNSGPSKIKYIPTALLNQVDSCVASLFFVMILMVGTNFVIFIIFCLLELYRRRRQPNKPEKYTQWILTYQSLITQKYKSQNTLLIGWFWNRKKSDYRGTRPFSMFHEFLFILMFLIKNLSKVII